MQPYLTIQNRYDAVEFLIMQNTVRGSASIDKKEVSKYLVPELNQLLHTNALSLHDLQFMAVNLGPAPITTLRVMLATVQGISFATKIPVVGIDGLTTFLEEFQDPHYPITVALFNAFNQEVFFGVCAEGVVKKGYQKIEFLLTEIKKNHGSSPIRFIGNGTLLYKDLILNMIPHAHIPAPCPEYCSLAYLAHKGTVLWEKESGITYHPLPLYLKQII